MLLVLVLSACKKDEPPELSEEVEVTESAKEPESPESKTKVFPGEDVLAVQAKVEEEFGPVESVQIINFMDNDERRTPKPGWTFIEFRLTEKSGSPSLIDFKGNAYKPRGKPSVVVFEVPHDVVSQTLTIEVGTIELTFKFADLVTYRLLKSPEFLSQ